MTQEQDQPDRRCKHCGTPLASETTNGLCPRCLLEMNLASRTMPDGEATPQSPPPSPEEMAERFPQFEILECLGRGGMGIVYKAWQKSLKRMVAIKVLAPERVGEPRFAEHFAREAQTLAKMSHPNIVTVHEFGESDGTFYLVMEFVDGVNLRDVLRDGRMEPAHALAIVPEICGALQFAHDHGVVHRDIKPENILLDRDGRVKIADFGIAALVGADADRSGTPPYMAPEQQAGKGSVDSRADIYALGVVFYEMLTGERPEQDPSRPSKRVEIDVRLDEIVLRALEKEPARRYQTAGEFRTVVETMVTRPGTEASARLRREPTDPTVKSVMAVLFAIALGLALMGFNTMPWPMNGSETLLFVVILLAGFGVTVYVFRPFWKQAFGNASQGQGAAPQTARGVAVDWRLRGVDRRSKRTLFGLPLWHVASGIDPETGRPRTARGIIAIGDRALGVVAIGGVAMGGFAFGGLSIGAVSYGGLAVGMLAMGGFGIALLAAIAGMAVAPVALGGMATGWYACGGRAFGAHVISGTAAGDPVAHEFFQPWSSALMGALPLANISLISAILLFGVGVPLWMQFRGGTNGDAPLSRASARAQGRRLAVLVGLISVIIVAGIGLAIHFCGIIPGRDSMEHGIGWEKTKNAGVTAEEVAREPYVGEWEWREGSGSDDFCILILKDDGKAVIMEDGEDGEAGTWTLADDGITMTIGDETIAGFLDPEGQLVLGKNRGAPRFTRKGTGRAGEQRVTDGRQHTVSEKIAVEEAACERVARDFIGALMRADVDGMKALLAPMSPLPQLVDLDQWVTAAPGEIRKAYMGDVSRLTTFTEWLNEDDWAVARTAAEPDNPGRGLHLVLQRTEAGWRVMCFDTAKRDVPLRDYLVKAQRYAGVQPWTGRGNAAGSDPKEAARAYMEAVRRRDYHRAAGLTGSPLDRKEFDILATLMSTLYGKDADRMTEFTESHLDDPYAVVRIASPPAKLDIRPSLILRRSENTWEVLGGPFPAAAGTSSAEELERVRADFQEPDDERIEPRLREVLPTLNGEALPPNIDVGRAKAVAEQPVSRKTRPADADDHARDQARQLEDLSTMKEYATALAIYQVDAGSLPPNLEMLVARKILPELKLMENHATGNREMPIYHGGPNLQVGESDTSRIMLLAVPSPSPDGRRVVGFLDASVKVIDESRYQSQLAWQRKPPMERTIDDFLESCAEKGMADDRQMFAALGMPEFIERFGDGQRAMRKHREQLHPAMRWAFDEATGDPSPACLRYLRGVHRDGDPRHAKQAFLMLKMLGVEEHPVDGASAEDLPQPDRDMLLAHARDLENGDFAALEQAWEFESDLHRQLGRLLAAAFARAEKMTVELVSTQRLNENSLFACYLMRNGPELFGATDAPHFTTFHRREDGWRCAPPGSLRTLVAGRTMGSGQIGRRGIAEKLIYQRYGHSDGAEQLARLKAMRDAAIRLSRPPHKLTMCEELAESLKTAILTEEEAQGESWGDSWHKLIKEQPEEVLPGPGDFFVSFYRECEAGDAQLSRSLSVAGEEGTFSAERFPCMTDSMLLEACVKAVPGSNDPQIEIQFTGSGARILESVTRQSIGKRLACVVDGKVISTPKVMAPINTGSMVITGGFSQKEAEAIVKKMNTLRDQARDFLDSLEKEAAVDANQ